MHSICIEPWTPLAVARRSAQATVVSPTATRKSVKSGQGAGLMGRVSRIEHDVYGPKSKTLRQSNGRPQHYDEQALLLSIPEDRHVTFSQWKTAFSKLIGQPVARSTFRNYVNRLRTKGKVAMDELEGAYGATEFYWRKVSTQKLSNTVKGDA